MEDGHSFHVAILNAGSVPSTIIITDAQIRAHAIVVCDNRTDWWVPPEQSDQSVALVSDLV